MMRTGTVADASTDVVPERPVCRHAVAQRHEQDDAHVGRAIQHDVLADHEALEHLGYLLHLPVDLGGANPDAARVERSVAATKDHEAVIRRALRPVSVTPRAFVMLEVRRAIPGAVGIVPERHRHAGKRLRADQFTGHADDWIGVGIPHLDGHAEPETLQFAAMHGERRRAQRKTGDQVRAAADAAQAYPRRDRCRHPVVRMLGQRTACAVHDIQRRQVVINTRHVSEFFGRREELRAGAEVRDPFSRGEAPQDSRFTTRDRRTIVQHHRGTDGE